MHRTIRWLDRSISAHARDDEQSIFPIVQGGLQPDLRKVCAAELNKRNTRGYAVGGLSGGESKDEFWRTVHLCTDLLPENKPRYLMGVGFAADLVVCVALGIDMFDCVYPTRTARFGCALTRRGQMNLKQQSFKTDMRPIEEGCDCSTCKTYTRSYLHHIVTVEPVACSIISIHNVAFQNLLPVATDREDCSGTSTTADNNLPTYILSVSRVLEQHERQQITWWSTTPKCFSNPDASKQRMSRELISRR